MTKYDDKNTKRERLKKGTNTGIVILSYVAFIALGMPDGLLGVAWPSIRSSFNIPLDSVGMLLTASVAGYLTSSFLSGALVTRFGVGSVLAGSCAITGIGLIGYTIVPAWLMMVMLGILAGLGAGAIDAGLNAYAASHFGENLMQWLHASYGIGITLGPIIMTMTLTLLNSWRMGYNIVGTFQIVLGFCFILTLSMWNNRGDDEISKREKKLTDYKTSIIETLRQPRVWLSMLLFFLYTGSEVTLGTWAYTLLTESRGISPEAAGFWASSYWATFTIGRIAAGLYAKRLGVNLLITGSLIAALAGSVLLLWNPSGIINLVSVALIGFAIAPIFPALMSGTSRRVGAHFAANTIGFQMASGSIGVALIPSLIGIAARKISLEVIPIGLIILFICQLGLYVLAIRMRMKEKL